MSNQNLFLLTFGAMVSAVVTLFAVDMIMSQSINWGEALAVWSWGAGVAVLFNSGTTV